MLRVFFLFAFVSIGLVDFVLRGLWGIRVCHYIWRMFENQTLAINCKVHNLRLCRHLDSIGFFFFIFPIGGRSISFDLFGFFQVFYVILNLDDVWVKNFFLKNCASFMRIISLFFRFFLEMYMMTWTQKKAFFNNNTIHVCFTSRELNSSAFVTVYFLPVTEERRPSNSLIRNVKRK